MKRSCVLYTGIVCIKCNDILYTHAGELLKCGSTVERFAADTFALAAFIEIRHDDIDSAGFAADCSNGTLQILEVIIRGHQVCETADSVGKTVVAYIHHKVNIVATDGFTDLTFTFTGTKTWCFDINDVRITSVSLKCKRI